MASANQHDLRRFGLSLNDGSALEISPSIGYSNSSDPKLVDEYNHRQHIKHNIDRATSALLHLRGELETASPKRQDAILEEIAAKEKLLSTARALEQEL